MKANFEKIGVEIYGGSHSKEIGAMLSGVKVDTRLTLKEVERLLRIRRGGGIYSTARKEKDVPILRRGLEKVGDEYEVTGDIEIVFENCDVKKEDYESFLPRPSHADYVAYMRDGHIESGGGRFSGRMTAPLCAVGGIAEELLLRRGVRVLAYVGAVGRFKLAGYDDVPVYDMDLTRLRGANFPCLFEEDEIKAEEILREVALLGDSVGGVVECVIVGLKAGEVGEAMFEGLEGKLAYAAYGVPAVKGVEFGDGFGLSRALGSEANDAMRVKDGKVAFLSNRNGGVNGGISNGEPVTMRVAIKPTPSIYLPQKTVDLGCMRDAEIVVKGRHDSCIVPRAVAAVEAAASLAVYDEILKYEG